MKNGMVGVSVWENNREDSEDSATQVGHVKNDENVLWQDFVKVVWKMFTVCLCCQVVTLEMQRGDQVYLELMSGRKLCTHLQYNIFTGYILYPYTDE